MDTLELFLCAQINYGNALKIMPALKLNPMFDLTQEQLKEAIEQYKKEQEQPDG